jgi:hypothetical protein
MRINMPAFRRCAVAIGLALVALLCAGCGAAAPAQVSADDLVHIHRLQPAPDDGLYVATHTGLYLMDSGGKITGLGDATHDLMGFTVAGPGDLLASGHPDLGDESLQVQGKAPLLGLVGSSDGVRWQPLSLLGDVDFHSLVTAHEQVYGLDSQTGALMVSNDRRAWDVRAEGLPFTDIAVDPTDPDTLLGAGAASVAASADGGRSWRLVGEQRLQYLSWNGAGLFGISPDGAVVTSTDGGVSWRQRSVLGGTPHALLVTNNAVFVANQDGIYASDDGGETFTAMMELTAAE